ncbi:hypothetical protein N7509_007540 [Penicillium cosmopolitanum]|uniref:RlpA-like protein double-psi beta-barrel domain-containing protein n=1 Tax=Penicillium cosmopolitanum TaxID=1131564 RepID=A0A9W9VZB3_9EURO|nr:uncharacterized protein N7509_007540 [Penicillium cosmopolitanum]KAJ5392050.1 hypothetical protein N7509_007540 [Penicillium cosmopolitanum]
MVTTSPEKHPQHSTTDPESPVSPISDPSAPHDNNSHDAWNSMPKRKPVPVPATATGADSPTKETESKTKLAGFGATFSAFLTLNWYRDASQRQKRKYLIIGAAIAGVLLLALIIGLAVGLTVGKKKSSSSSNLALPTSHGGPYSGDLTYYNPGLGSCGYTNSDTDLICAVSHVLFDAASTGSNPNENPLCGMKLRLRRDGASVDVKVVDRCVGCKETDLDVTETVFKKVADVDQGRVLMDWAWLEQAPVSVS